ncbi:MAG TPA: efflux RND transporter permease subunit, partial [Candidatus Binatus sp.]|nr:efflux RND transporter permease subunit [Candidatus Binatus sp.]
VILARTIPSAVFPEIIFRRATILADSGDLPADQMLASVTRPLENAAYTVPGVTLVRSTTTRGSAEIDVAFGEDADPQISYQMLSAAVSHTRSLLPSDTAIDTALLTTGTFPIVDISMSSKIRSLPELTDFANYDLVPSLHRIDGTYRVEVIGGKYREFVVRLDPARMLQHDMSPGDVVAGLSKNNVIASAGRMNESHRMLLTVVTTDLHQADQIAALPLTAAGGQPVRVSDVASVELGITEDYVRAACENGAAVLVGISRRPSGSTEEVAAQARQILAEFRQRYPDVQYSISYDQSDLVVESIKSVRDAIVLGLALAVLVVLAFTMSPLSALIAAIVVPCTVAITFVVMKAAGLTFNMMTLGGLAAGIGLFIDDAIVMIEAIHRELAAGQSATTAVTEALKHLRRPLIASTLTVIVVFGPLVFTSGITGIFFRSLAATLGGGLAISLILAIYFTPAMEIALARFRRRAREAGRIYEGVQAAFLGTIRPIIRFPVLAIPLAIASVCVAYFMYTEVGTDYLPPLDEGAFILDYITPPQSTMADTTALLDKIQSILKSTPEVVAFSRRTGTQLGFFLTESNRGDMSVRLRAKRKRDIDDIIASVRERILNSVPGVEIEFSQVLQDLIGDLSGVPEPIEVKVFGPDQKTIEATARQVADRMRSIKGLVDVFNGIVLSIPEQAVVVDNTSAAHYGLSADDVRTALDSVIQGTVATNVLSGDRLVGVRVRYPDAFREDLGTLSEVTLKSSTHARVPLAAVTKINYLGETSEIDR